MRHRGMFFVLCWYVFCDPFRDLSEGNILQNKLLKTKGNGTSLLKNTILDSDLLTFKYAQTLIVVVLILVKLFCCLIITS